MIDSGESASSSNEMEDKFEQILEKQNKEQAKTLQNPFLSLVKSATDKAGGRQLKKSESAESASSVSVTTVLRRKLKKKGSQAQVSVRRRRKELGSQVHRVREG